MARRLSPLVAISLFLGAGFVASQGCNIYTEDIHHLTGATTAIPTASDGNGIGWWSKQEGACFSAGEPTVDDRPAAASTTELDPIVLGLASLRLGARDEDGSSDGEAWKEIGFDLDGVCTSSDTCSNDTADGPVVGCISKTSLSDGKDCRDNMLGFRVGAVEELTAGPFKISEIGFNCSLCQGVYNMMVKISGYNGEANDDQIRIDLFASPGVASNPFMDKCSASADSFVPALCWEKSSDFRFNVDKAYLDGAMTGNTLPDSKFADPQAFVRDGYVVMQVPDGMDFWFPHTLDAPVYAFPFKFHHAVVVAKIAKSKGEWTLTDGTVAGKLYEKEIYESFGKLGLCEGDNLYQTLKTFASGSLDITREAGADASKECDAMSFGIRFTAREALVGDAVTVTQLTKCDGTVDPI